MGMRGGLFPRAALGFDDVEQIVGPERRLRALHHHWSGEG